MQQQEKGVSKSRYARGIYAPASDEQALGALDVEGELPSDLGGTFLRNMSNPRFEAPGRYHWFDGDGMIHAITIRGGRASFRNRWVRTPAFEKEEAAGKALWTGIMEPPDMKREGGPFKNTANTDLIFHHGKLLALWWQTGDAYHVDLDTLETRGAEDFAGTHKAGLTAHPKVDPATGEMMFMHYGMKPPFLRYGVAEPDGRVSHFVEIGTPGPRLQHDIAITERYTVLMDLPMYNDPEAMAKGKTRVRFYRDEPSRFGILPRRGSSGDVRWFEASPCYMYHTVNAWEDGSKVVLLGCKIDTPLALDDENPTLPRRAPTLGVNLLAPRLHRWQFDLETGKVDEAYLDSDFTEFPRIDPRVLGRPSSVSYHAHIANADTLLFDGIVRYEHARGKRTALDFPHGHYGSEVVFAPRAGSTEPDDGYLITLVTLADADHGEAWVLDAKDVECGPIARIHIPTRIPIGFHTHWVDDSQLESRRP